MQVGQLIEYLQKFDPELFVFMYNSENPPGEELIAVNIDVIEESSVVLVGSGEGVCAGFYKEGDEPKDGRILSKTPSLVLEV